MAGGREYPPGRRPVTRRPDGGIVIFMVDWLAQGYAGTFDILFGIAISNAGHL